MLFPDISSVGREKTWESSTSKDLWKMRKEQPKEAPIQGGENG